jgi:hypothetical protein
VEAAALWRDRRGHPSAFTAGACAAAGLATDLAAALGALLLAILVARGRSAPITMVTPASRVPGRLRTAVWTAVVLALPLPLWRVPPLGGPTFAWPAASEVVTHDERAAMAWIRDHTRPLDLVCAPDVPAARWIPALAARATTAPLGPGWPRPEGPCSVRISLSGLLPPGVNGHEPPAFRAGGAAVWTTSQKR